MSVIVEMEGEEKMKRILRTDGFLENDVKYHQTITAYAELNHAELAIRFQCSCRFISHVVFDVSLKLAAPVLSIPAPHFAWAPWLKSD